MSTPTEPRLFQHVSKLPRAGICRLPSPTKLAPFSEMTASTMNSRNGEMPPPSNDAVTGMKRKTLAERAGEPHRKPQAPSVSKQTISGIKASALAGSYRQPSYSSSMTSSRPSSVASSRNVSNGSYTSTISTGSRPPSAQAHRPQSAMAGSRIQKPQFVQGRPASSMEGHTSGPATGRGQGKSNGRNPFSSNLVDCPEDHEFNREDVSNDTQRQPLLRWASSIPPRKSQRDVSFSTALDGHSLSELQLASEPKVTQRRDLSITTALGNMSLATPDHGEKPFPSCPTTPSHIPKLKPKASVFTLAPSPTKSPQRAPAPLTKYMNRNTNTPFHEVFDPDDRLMNMSMNMENMMSDFKKTLSGATSESAGLREMLNVYKARGLRRIQCTWFMLI